MLSFQVFPSDYIDMKLQFGTRTKDSASRAIVFHSVAFIAMFAHLFMQPNYAACETSIPNFHVEYKELPWKDILTCYSPYFVDCLCSSPLNRTEGSDDCNIEIYRTLCRPFTLLWLLFQIFLVRELFTLVGRFSQIIIRVSHIVSCLTYIYLTIFMYQDDCLHRYVAIFLHFSILVLGPMALRDMLDISRHESTSRRSNHAVIYAILMEQTENQVKSWHELV